MKDQLAKFISNQFQPYGSFPARKDVEQELLANLTEKYEDLKSEGKTDEEAYAKATESFGDVSEIMRHVAHTNQPIEPEEDKQSLRKIITDSILTQFAATTSHVFRATSLEDTDLAVRSWPARFRYRARS